MIALLKILWRRLGRHILYVGSLTEGCNSYMRFKTLSKMGNELAGVDIDRYIYNNFFVSLHHHFNVGPGISLLNRIVLKKIRARVPDVLWIDNKPFLQRETLKEIRLKWPGIKIINLLTDDPTGKFKYAWRTCLSTAKYYDIHFVQREINIVELESYGAKRVEICYRSFDPAFHRPLKLNDNDIPKYKTKVGFVGTHEINREEWIVHLIKNKIPVTITGNDWQNAINWKIIEPYYKGPSVYGNDYIKTINGMDIALHFLRHVNRDDQDSRTFEIPACKVFMLAERSKLHSQLFEENEEAVFFTSKEELEEKVKFYLTANEERHRIALNGYNKCISGGYDHQTRLENVLSRIYNGKK